MQKLDLLGVQAFIAVAESGSFIAASRYLHLSQTALTRRLQKLEDSVGVKLVERTTRSVSVTSAGMEFLPRAVRTVGELAGALAQLRDNALDQSETVVLGCLPTVAASRLGPVLSEHRRRFPKTRIRVVDASTTEIRNLTLAGELDIAISVMAAPHADLVSELLFLEPMVVACRQDHAFASLPAVRWKDLEGEALIGLHALSGNRRLVDEVIKKHDLALPFAFEVQHISTAVGLVAGGAGIAVLTESSLMGTAPDRVVTVKLRSPEVARNIELFRRKDRPLSPAATALREMVIAAMRSRRRARH